MGALTFKVLNEFRESGFFVVTKNEERQISIEKRKITSEQYHKAIEILKKLDENGFDEKERK